MFKETKDGQTNYCSHTKDNSICDKCLGKSSYESGRKDAFREAGEMVKKMSLKFNPEDEKLYDPFHVEGYNFSLEDVASKLEEKAKEQYPRGDFTARDYFGTDQANPIHADYKK